MISFCHFTAFQSNKMFMSYFKLMEESAENMTHRGCGRVAKLLWKEIALGKSQVNGAN